MTNAADFMNLIATGSGATIVPIYTYETSKPAKAQALYGALMAAGYAVKVTRDEARQIITLHVHEIAHETFRFIRENI